jgi:hypothetical protein
MASVLITLNAALLRNGVLQMLRVDEISGDEIGSGMTDKHIIGVSNSKLPIFSSSNLRSLC